MGTRIETWGILDRFVSMETLAAIWTAQRVGSRYYNKLVEGERAKRITYAEERTRLAPQIAPKLAELEALEPEELTNDEKKLLKELRKQVGACDQLVLISRDLDEQLDHRQKELRKQLYWGQAGLEDQAFTAARKTRGMGPNFRRFDGSGRVGGQLQNGARKFLNGATNNGTLHITDQPWPGTSARIVRLRLGSTETNEPIWAQLPVKIHRELPADAVIKYAWIRLRRHGGRTRMDLQLSVESRTYEVRAPLDDSMVAIDIGWKRERDADGRIIEGKAASLRVASCGDDKSVRHLHLPWKNCGSKYSEIKSIRDKLCTEERQRVWAIRRELSMISAEVAEHLQHMADPDPHAGPQKGRWRSTSALAKLYRRLKDQAPDHLTAWWHRDKHLWQYEGGDRRRAAARRRDIYRVFARDLEEQYSYCILEEFKVSNVRRTKGSGAEAQSSARACQPRRTRPHPQRGFR